MSIKREIIEIVTVTCDFCGEKFEPSKEYPRGKHGELGIFGLALTFRIEDPITGTDCVYGQDSPTMGYCSGHICQKCLHEITTRIAYNKGHTAVKEEASK